MQVATCFRARDADLKTKTRPVTWTLKPDAVIQSTVLVAIFWNFKMF